jgi:hypothetical protein
MTTTSIPTTSAAKPATSGSRDDYLRSRWDDALAAKMDPVQRLIYRSNILGADARITNTGGGNTSSKIEVDDPLTGERTRVLWVKGSGGDLRTATKANFASLYLDQVLNLRTLYEKYEQRGPKTPAEDAMVGMYPYTTFDRNPTASSIDTYRLQSGVFFSYCTCRPGVTFPPPLPASRIGRSLWLCRLPSPMPQPNRIMLLSSTLLSPSFMAASFWRK